MTGFFGRVPRAVYVVAALSHVAFISFLSHVPGERLPSAGLGMSLLFNFMHAPIFAVLAAWIALALWDRASAEPLSNARSSLAVALAVGFALFDEWHQSFVSGRSSDPIDLITDLAGSAGGVLAVRILLGSRSAAAPIQLTVCFLVATISAGFAALGAR